MKYYMKELLLSERDAHVLDEMCELYIRIGLGQLSEIGKFISLLFSNRDINIQHICDTLKKLENDLLENKEWKLDDIETSSNVIAAFGIQSKLGENYKAWEWASRQLYLKKDVDPIC